MLVPGAEVTREEMDPELGPVFYSFPVTTAAQVARGDQAASETGLPSRQDCLLSEP